MKIIMASEKIGLIWYTALNYKQKQTHVVCFGLQVKQFDSEKAAKDEVKACLDWHAENH